MREILRFLSAKWLLVRNWIDEDRDGLGGPRFLRPILGFTSP